VDNMENSYDKDNMDDIILDNSNMFVTPDGDTTNENINLPKNEEKTGTIIKSIDSGASITADMILKYLLNEGVIVDSDLIGLLGEERHHLTIPGLERALARESRISDISLAKLKGALSGKDYIKSNETKTKILFDKIVSKNLGAIGIESENIKIAMIEDTPAHIEKLSEVLGSNNFEIVFCTISQFKELYSSCYENSKVKDKAKTIDLLEILDECIRNRGSDVHISVGLPPVIRVDGKLTMMDRQILDAEWMRTQVYNLVGKDQFSEIERRHDYDMALPYGTARFRVNIGMDNRGFTIVARKLPTKIPTPIDLNLPEAIQKFTELDRGLVLVTGPTGSGKSTTLASLLAEISIKHQKHIITLEDPIEFTLPRGRSVVNQRQLHASFTSFGNALRQALRQDPDVILVGEMRDLETIRTAVQAAETGHLVFGTLHTYDAASTVARIVSSFPAEEQDQVRAQLGSIVKGIVSQTLLGHRSGTGRVAAYEILVSTPAISNNLRKVDGHLSLRQSIEMGKADGMQTMDIALANLVHRGLVTEEAAREKCVDLENFKKLSKGG